MCAGFHTVLLARSLAVILHACLVCLLQVIYELADEEAANGAGDDDDAKRRDKKSKKSSSTAAAAVADVGAGRVGGRSARLVAKARETKVDEDSKVRSICHLPFN